MNFVLSARQFMCLQTCAEHTRLIGDCVFGRLSRHRDGDDEDDEGDGYELEGEHSGEGLAGGKGLSHFAKPLPTSIFCYITWAPTPSSSAQETFRQLAWC